MKDQSSKLNAKKQDSFAVDLVKAQQTSTPSFTDKFAAYLCGTLLDAGSDTTHNTLMGFIQAMLLFPDVQRKAQEAIDTVCGDRMPAPEDLDNPDMQFIRACVKESLRWMPTGILGFPHATTRDDEYRGYKIPKGAMVICNTWYVRPSLHLMWETDWLTRVNAQKDHPPQPRAIPQSSGIQSPAVYV